MQTIRLHFLFLLTFSSLIFAQEQIGVAAAVNRNTTDLTLEQERKLVEAGYQIIQNHTIETDDICLLYTSPSPRDKRQSRMPSSA